MVAGVLAGVELSNLKNVEPGFKNFGTGAESKTENVT